MFFLLIMHACARPLFLRTVFQILFQISQLNGKNGNPKQISQHDLSVEIGILKSKSRFRNQTHPKAFKSLMNNNINNKNDPIQKDQGSIKKLVLRHFLQDRCSDYAKTWRLGLTGPCSVVILAAMLTLYLKAALKLRVTNLESEVSHVR